jgi:VIT1/CCC1 family predicted Fe2+/Mn2+ transporter
VLQTLLNQEGGSCVASAVLVYLALAVLALFTARVAFTSPHLLRKYSPLAQ